MKVYYASNTNDMAAVVYAGLHEHGVYTDSRNGRVLRIPGPVAMVYSQPWQRVNFCPVRDANPFFHLMESMWMLAGSRDVAWIEQFNGQIGAYSDDGKTFNAAYGYRLRREWGDQLVAVIERLRADPNDRQTVASIWNPYDLWRDSKDKACNLSLVFGINPDTGRMDMVVYNRSNDLIWGSVTGANPVHLSMFQQYVADGVGVPIGEYTQITSNGHVYVENPQWNRLVDHYMARGWVPHNPYLEADMPYAPHPMFTPENREGFDEDVTLLTTFLPGTPISPIGFKTPFVRNTVVPMYNAYVERKFRKNLPLCMKYLDVVESRDWQRAGIEWVSRRLEK